MVRLIVASIIAAAILAAAAFGQSSATSKPAAQPNVIELTISPAPAPVPALRYQFMPDLAERSPGNAAALLDRVAVIAASIPRIDDLPLWRVEPKGDLLDQPVDALRAPEITKALNDFSDVFRGLRTACFREYCRWDIPYVQEGTGTLLPNLRFFRLIARALAMRMRLDIADGKLDRGFDDLRMGYVFSQYVGNEGTLIHTLVGVRQLELFMVESRSWVTRPDAPNLVYAFAGLPRPFFRTLTPLSFERGVFIFDLPALRELDRRVFTQAELDTLIAGLIAVAGEADKQADVGKEIPAAIRKSSPRARAGVEKAHPNAPVGAMRAEQVALLYAYDRFQIERDEVYRWFLFPYAQSAQRLAESSRKFSRDQRSVDNGYPFSIYMASLISARYRIERAERDLAVLQLIESLRLHLVQHQDFPATLDEVVEVPLPLNPLTGRPFEYERHSPTHATLIAAAPHQPPAETTRYQLHLRK